MTFGEKVHAARTSRNWTQDQLCEVAGVSKRALINYETKGILPKSRDTYYKLAEALGMDAEVVLDDDTEFVLKAGEQFGSRGAKQALQLVQQVNALYAGGELDDEDMEAMHKALQDAYMIAKQRNKRHTNKRYLVKEEQ